MGGFCVVREIVNVKLKGSKKAKKKTSSEDLLLIEASRRFGGKDLLAEDSFYDISEARELMAKNYMRDGDARYAVKYLQPDLDPLEKARGKIDMAIEAKYLSVVKHPNIVKMRAWAACDPLSGGDSFFLVLDRLYDTLDTRMEKWKQVKKKAKGPLQGFCGVSGL